MLRFVYCLLAIATLFLTSLQINAEVENTNGCDTFCPLSYLPVCGTNDSGETKTFPNECVMKSQNCVNKWNFQRTANGTCP